MEEESGFLVMRHKQINVVKLCCYKVEIFVTDALA